MKRKFLQKESGTSLVEFALVLPLLILFVFGIVEFGVAFYNKAMLTNASREGARAGIVFNVDGSGDWQFVGDADPNYISDTVNNYLSNYLITFGSPTNANVSYITTTNPATGAYSPGGHLRVDVTYTYTYLVLPNFVASLMNPLNFTATTVMRFE